MQGILDQRQRIVNCWSLLRTNRWQSGGAGALAGHRRDQTVDEAGELAAGIVVRVGR